MSLDVSTSAATVVSMQQAQMSTQLGVALLKHQADSQQAVANTIVSSSSSVYNAQGRAVAAPGQLINGRA